MWEFVESLFDAVPLYYSLHLSTSMTEVQSLKILRSRRLERIARGRRRRLVCGAFLESNGLWVPRPNFIYVCHHNTGIPHGTQQLKEMWSLIAVVLCVGLRSRTSSDGCPYRFMCKIAHESAESSNSSNFNVQAFGTHCQLQVVMNPVSEMESQVSSSVPEVIFNDATFLANLRTVEVVKINLRRSVGVFCAFGRNIHTFELIITRCPNFKRDFISVSIFTALPHG